MALAMPAWETADVAAGGSWRAAGVTAAVDEAFGVMEKACLLGLDSM
jgi:hypothetical protein